MIAKAFDKERYLQNMAAKAPDWYWGTLNVYVWIRNVEMHVSMTELTAWEGVSQSLTACYSGIWNALSMYQF